MKRTVFISALFLLAFSTSAFAAFRDDLTAADSALHWNNYKAAENYYAKAAVNAKTTLQADVVTHRLGIVALIRADLTTAKTQFTKIATEKTAGGFYVSSAYFYLGCIAEKQGDTTTAKSNFESAAATTGISSTYAAIINNSKLSAKPAGGGTITK